MGFSLSVGGFFSFLLKPFTNPVGIVMMIGVGVYIFLRVTGRIGFKRDKPKGGSGGGNADYIIK